MGKIKLGETKKLTKERWLNLYETDFVKSDGKPGRWVFASRNRNEDGTPNPKSDAVVIVPTVVVGFEESRLCMIKEFRIPIQGYEYHFPAGLIEKGEDLGTAARRELKEEAGLELLNITRVSPNLYSSTGLTDESAVMVFADCKYTGEKQQLDSTEEIETMFLTHSQVVELVDNMPKGVGQSAKTWPVLLMYKAIGKF